MWEVDSMLSGPRRRMLWNPPTMTSVGCRTPRIRSSNANPMSPVCSSYFTPLPPNNCQQRHYLFSLSLPFACLFICLSGQALLLQYLMNCLDSFHKTTDDLIRFWRSKGHSRSSRSAHYIPCTTCTISMKLTWNNHLPLHPRVGPRGCK